MYAQEAIAKLKEIITTNLNNYREAINDHEAGLIYRGQLERGDDSALKEELKPIENACIDLLGLLSEAEKQIPGIPKDSTGFLKDPLKTDLIKKLEILSDQMSEYWTRHDYENELDFVKDFLDPNTIDSLSFGATVIEDGFDSTIFDVDDSEEAKTDRNNYVQNIKCIQQFPANMGKKSSYENLNDNDKKAYHQIIDHWWKNVKDKGFEASIDYISDICFREYANNGLTKGEEAARNDLFYTIFCPLNEEGKVNFDKAHFLADGFTIYNNSKQIAAGKKGLDYAAQNPNASDSEVHAAVDNSKEGYEAYKLNYMLQSIGFTVAEKTTDSNKNTLYSRLLKSNTRYNYQLSRKNDDSSKLINTYVRYNTANLNNEQSIAIGEGFINRANSPEDNANLAAFQNYNEFQIENSSFDMGYTLMDKCASLNKIYRKLIDTKNAYLGHTNTALYKNMMASLGRVEDLSASLLINGQNPNEAQRQNLLSALNTAEDNIKSYAEAKTKAKYDHDPGEVRRDLTLAAYGILNVAKAEKIIKGLNNSLRELGKDKISLQNLNKKYSTGMRDVIDKQNIEQGCQNHAITDENLIRMLKNPQQLDDYRDMFNVKHHVRVIRWNSGLYNDTRKAIKRFQKYRNRVNDYFTGKKPMDEQKLASDIQKLKEYYNKSRELLPRYCKKVMGADYLENGDANSRGTSAGKLRAAGAGGALDEFFGYANTSERAKKQTSFKELYNKEMAKNKMENNSGKHRKSAKAATVKYKAAKENNNQQMNL